MKNAHYDDCYFSEMDGLAESEHVFLQGNGLEQRLEEILAHSGRRTAATLRIGETGFGSGLNLLCLLSSASRIIQADQTLDISYFSIEKYPLSKDRIRELISPFAPELDELYSTYHAYWEQLHPGLSPGWNQREWSFGQICLDFHLFWGDARDWSGGKAEKDREIEAWFLDGHSPDKNPEIWAPEIMQAVYDRTASGGSVASFTAAGLVKRGLREAGFIVKRKKGYGKKRHMIRGDKL